MKTCLELAATAAVIFLTFLAGIGVGYQSQIRHTPRIVIEEPCDCAESPIRETVCDAGDYLMARDENGVGHIVGTPQCCWRPGR